MIQGEFNLETEVNRLIYGEDGLADDIIKIIKLNPDKFNKMEHDISIESTLVENGRGKLSFKKGENQELVYSLDLNANYKSMEISKNIFGNVFNREIDDCDNGLVYLQDRSQDYINKLGDILTAIPDTVDLDFLPAGHSLIRPINCNDIRIDGKPYGPSKVYFNKSDCNYSTISNNRLFLILKRDEFNRNNVVIDSSGYDSVMLSGIIYIENGDLTFIGRTNFQGLILIKDGHIKREGNEKSTVVGKVVLDSFKDPRDAIEINYGYQNYIKYAKHLPPLLEPEIIKVGIE